MTPLNLSNLRKLLILRADMTNKPYVFTFYMRCNNTELFAVNRKEAGVWELHYVSHAETFCEHCGKVGLYSDCKHFSALVKQNYSDVLTFLRENK